LIFAGRVQQIGRKIMPAVSKKQQSAMGMAYAAKKGKLPEDKLKGSSKEMYDSMSASKLKDFAKTPRKDLPEKKAEVTTKELWEKAAKCMGAYTVESKKKPVIKNRKRGMGSDAKAVINPIGKKAYENKTVENYQRPFNPVEGAIAGGAGGAGLGALMHYLTASERKRDLTDYLKSMLIGGGAGALGGAAITDPRAVTGSTTTSITSDTVQ
jgi:hypothetical protein